MSPSSPCSRPIYFCRRSIFGRRSPSSCRRLLLARGSPWRSGYTDVVPRRVHWVALTTVFASPITVSCRRILVGESPLPRRSSACCRRAVSHLSPSAHLGRHRTWLVAIPNHSGRRPILACRRAIFCASPSLRRVAVHVRCRLCSRGCRRSRVGKVADRCRRREHPVVAVPLALVADHASVVAVGDGFVAEALAQVAIPRQAVAADSQNVPSPT